MGLISNNHRLWVRKTYYKSVILASFLPNKIINLFARKFDTPGVFEGDIEEGSCFWMDASYAKWARNDQRKYGR